MVCSTEITLFLNRQVITVNGDGGREQQIGVIPCGVEQGLY